MKVKVYHVGDKFEDLIAKNLIVLDNNNTIFKGKVIKLLFKCGPIIPSHVLLEGIEEFNAKIYELFIKDCEFV